MVIEHWNPDLAAVAAPYLQRSVEFERSQVESLADVLQQIIDIVEFKPEPPYDAPLFKSMYSVPRLLEHVRQKTGG